MTLPSELPALAWSHFWQVTAVICLVGLVVRLGCRNKPQLAYLLWMLAVLKCITPPVWSSPTGIFSWVTLRVHRQHLQQADLAHGPEIPSRIVPVTVPITSHAADAHEEGQGVRRHGLSDESAAQGRTTRPDISLGVVLGVLWFVGAAALGLIALLKSWRLHRLARGGRLPDDDPIVRSVQRLAKQVGLRCRVRVATTKCAVGPAVWGIFRPCILLPERLLQCRSVQQLEPILAHELMHVLRRDVHLGAVQTIAQVLWWFHPLVWWANQQACHARERSCDQEVLARLAIRPGCYAKSLLDVLRIKRKAEWLTPAPGINSLHITSKRLEAIMQGTDTYQPHTFLRWCTLGLLGALVLLPGGALVIGQSSLSRDPTDQELETTDPPPATVDQPPGEQEPTAESAPLKLRGIAQPALDIALPAQLSGVVAAMDVRVGGQVKPGQLLARIKAPAAESSAGAAKVDLEIARLRAKQDVATRYAEMAMKVAEMNYRVGLEANRQSPGTVSELELKRRQLDWERATAQVEQERVNQQVAKLSAESKEAMLQAAREMAERSEVRALLAGEVVKTYVQSGEWVNAGDPMCRIVNMKTMLIRAQVAAGRFDPGEIRKKRVEIVARRARGRTASFVGKVTYTSPVIDAVTNAYEIHIAAENRRDPDDDWLLRANALVDVVLSD